MWLYILLVLVIIALMLCLVGMWMTYAFKLNEHPEDDE